MVTLIHQPSDKLFKLSMELIEVAEEFFTSHLPPALLTCVDLKTLQLEKQSFIDEVYKATEADVVYSVQMGKSTAYLYLLCEQQSSVDQGLAFRLLKYSVRIMALYHHQHPEASLPLVYPLVIYSGKEPWDAPLDLFSLFGEAEALAREMFFSPYQLLSCEASGA